MGEGPWPAMSPTHHTPGMTRMWPSTGTARADSSSPSAPTPRLARSARRPVATSIRSPMSAVPSPGASWRPSSVTLRLDAGDLDPGVDGDAFLLKRLGDELGGLGLLGAGQTLAPSPRWSRPTPKRDMAWPISRPMAPPPTTSSESGKGLGGDGPPVGPVRHGLEHGRDPGALPGGDDQRPARR